MEIKEQKTQVITTQILLFILGKYIFIVCVHNLYMNLEM